MLKKWSFTHGGLTIEKKVLLVKHQLNRILH